MTSSQSELGDVTARDLYDRARVALPTVRWTGLYRLAPFGFAFVCEGGPDPVGSDKSVIAWLDSHRPIHLKVDVVSEVPPPPAVELEPLSPSERAQHPIPPARLPELFSELCLALPRGFPEFEVEPRLTAAQEVVVRTAAPLTAMQSTRLREVAAACGFPKVVLGLFKTDTERTRPLSDQLYIMVSRSYPKGVPAEFRSIAEEDEDFWRDSRGRVFTDPEMESADALGPEWAPTTSRCLVTTAFPPRDIRSYLSLYGEVVLSPPLAGSESHLEALGVTAEELAELVTTGRVRLILPQSIERYSSSLLGPLGEVSSPGRVLMSRRLAAASVLDTRARLPLLYPAISIEERAVLLRALIEMSESGPEPLQKRLTALIAELSRCWQDWEGFIHQRGAMGVMSCGAGPMMASIFEQLTGRDLLIEFGAAGLAVEWARPLRAVVFPEQGSGYSSEGHTVLLAGLMSSEPRLVGPGPKLTLDVAEGLLSIADGPPAIEVAKHLGGADIERFRALTLHLARGAGPEGWRQAVERYNAAVQQFEARSSRLDRWDINLPTAASHAAGLVFGGLVAGPLGSLGGMAASYTAQQLFKRLDQRRGRYAGLGAALDTLRAMATRADPAVVLLARMRQSG